MNDSRINTMSNPLRLLKCTTSTVTQPLTPWWDSLSAVRVDRTFLVQPQASSLVQASLINFQEPGPPLLLVPVV